MLSSAPSLSTSLPLTVMTACAGAATIVVRARAATVASSKRGRFILEWRQPLVEATTDVWTSLDAASWHQRRRAIVIPSLIEQDHAFVAFVGGDWSKNAWNMAVVGVVTRRLQHASRPERVVDEEQPAGPHQ